MGFFYAPWDIWYFVLILPALLLSVIASSMVRTTFRKYDTMPAASGITGAAAAKRILDASDIRDVKIERVPGELTDHYDPRTKILRLSQATCDSTSVAAVGVAAHEAGHAIQHAMHYFPNKIRAVLVPPANIGSNAGPVLAVIGMIFNMPFLINIGIMLFSVAVFFYLVTLPVEFNASRRAMRMLESTGVLYGDELTGARRVLTAAAMTYIASLLMALANLARLILISRQRRR